MESVAYEEHDELDKELRGIIYDSVIGAAILALMFFWANSNEYFEVTYNNEIGYGAYLGDIVFIRCVFLVITITTYSYSLGL